MGRGASEVQPVTGREGCEGRGGKAVTGRARGSGVDTVHGSFEQETRETGGRLWVPGKG